MATATIAERNTATSAAEVAAFLADTPGPYFAYYKAASGWPTAGIVRLVRGDKLTTWTGDTLGTIQSAGDPFRDNFGGKRQNFRALGINGATYAGTAYLSAGDYVRMRPVRP